VRSRETRRVSPSPPGNIRTLRPSEERAVVLARRLFARLSLSARAAIFAFIFHHSIPTLAEPAIDKPGLGRAFATTLALVVAAYLLVSVPAVLLFGEDTQPAVSLNWNSYRPSYWPPLAAFVRGFVVFFPAVSLVSTYPLMCITLCNQIVAVCPPSARPRWVFRLVAAVPPLALSAAFNDLGIVTAAAGVCGFVVALIFPVALQRASRRLIEEQLGPGASRTAHSTAVTTRPWAVAAVGLVSVGMTLFFFANLVYQGILAPMWTADSDEPGEWGSYES